MPDNFCLEITPKLEVDTSEALSLVYTPGVGAVSSFIAENPKESYELTNRAFSFALISCEENISDDLTKKINAAEATSILIKQNSSADIFPLVIEKKSLAEISAIIQNLEPSFAGFILKNFSEQEFNEIKTNISLPIWLLEENLETISFKIKHLLPQNQYKAKYSKEISVGENSIELHREFQGVIKTEILPEKRNIKENLIAVISDGSAVLGLGNIGAEGGMPVMEGKAVLFKALGNVNAIPICLKTQDAQELISIISAISPILGGINLEDISAPRCFEIENTLKQTLDIPVFHDDQHGTAVVVLSAFINAMKLCNKAPNQIKVVVNGAGAGAIAVSKLLMKYGVKNLILCDRTGAIFEGRTEGMNFFKEEMAKITNPNSEKGLLKDVIECADLFIGLSSANVLTKEMIKLMAKNPIIFALANPVPEIMPTEAAEAGAFIVATGRSDFKNQVNNSLAFPGIFRGVLDVKASCITDEMKIAAALAIAGLVSEEELSSECIIPHALDNRVSRTVAKAVEQKAIEQGISRK